MVNLIPKISLPFFLPLSPSPFLSPSLQFISFSPFHVFSPSLFRYYNQNFITNMTETPAIIKGGTFSDDRGSMRFVNDFQFNDVKRFYFIKHLNVDFIRAWQGHQFEKKYFYPIAGSFILAWVKIDDFKNPSKNLVPEYHILLPGTSEIISIPKGYANGLKALEPNSEILIFSDMNLEESHAENIRYPSDWWMDWEKMKCRVVEGEMRRVLNK